jgi:hypothetical protein
MASFFRRKLQSLQLVDFLAILFVFIFCLSGILTLTEYGMTWDEGLGNFFFGERYFHYLSSFNITYLQFNEYLSMHKEHSLDLFKSPWKGTPEAFPALADIASAATMYIFSYKLEWLDPVDGFHLFSILLLSVFLITFYFFISKRLGKFVALFALIFLGVFPRLWGDMHFNDKDIPEMVFFGFTLLAYWKWFEKPSWSNTLWVGVAGGAALGVKANALFLPLFFVLGSWPLKIKELWLHIKNQFIKYFHMLVFGLITFFLSWPYLYLNPFNAKKYFSLIFAQGGRVGSTAWNWQPLSITASVIPEFMLFCLMIGIVFSVIQIIRNKKTIYRFALVWLLLPILRISIPPSLNFDGIRHFLEFVPGAALVAGIGAASIIELLAKQNKKRTILIAIIIFLLISINTGVALRTFGSYQYLYFNNIVGGLPGGERVFGQDEATDYWGSSYRKGIKWLNENAEINSKVYVPVAGHIVNMVEAIWLRDDIQVINKEEFTELAGADQPAYIMFITRPSFYNEVTQEYLSTHDPVCDINVDGIPVLVIYKK